MTTIDSPFDWASNATAISADHAPARPIDAQISQGYPEGEPVPAEEFNWALYMIGRGLMMSFDDLAAAVQGMTDGSGTPIEKSCLALEGDTDQEPGSLAFAIDEGSGNIGLASIDVDGEYVFYLVFDAATDPVAVLRDLSNTAAPSITYARSFIGTGQRIVSNGKYVAVAYGTFVEVFNRATAVLVWSHNHLATVYDIAIDGTNLYLVGATSAGIEAKAFTLAAGAAVWTYAHGSDLHSCATDGKRVFVSGLAAPAGSLSTLRCLVASSANDAANEGGTALDATGTAWDAIQATTITAGQRMTTDGRSLWIAYPGAAAAQIERRACGDGTILASETSGDTMAGIAHDHELVYAITNSGPPNEIRAFDRETLGQVWKYYNPHGNADLMDCVTSDGARVFFGAVNVVGAAPTVGRLYRGNRPSSWLRVDPDDDCLPMRQLIIPHE